MLWDQIGKATLLLTGCVILGKLLDFNVPPLHLQNGYNNHIWAVS